MRSILKLIGSNRFKGLDPLKALLFAIYFFLIIAYAAISLGKHYRFETHAYDLGIYDQVVWHLSRFERPESTILGFDNYFMVEHFEPVLLWLGLGYRFFSSPYLLLVVQLIFTFFVGGLGLYKLLHRLTGSRGASWSLILSWAISLGVQQAFDFDFHTSVLAAGLYPWLLYFWEKQDRRKAFLIFFGCLLFKEEAAFYLVGIALFWFVSRRQPKLALGLGILSLLWYWLVTKVVMSAYHFSNLYNHLGQTWPARIISVLNPWQLLSSLFGHATKISTWRYFAFSSLGLAFLSPGLVLLLPSFFRNLLTLRDRAWVVDFHYWIEAEYFLYISVAYFLSWLRKRLPPINFSTLAVKAAFFILVFTAFASLEEGRPLRDFANNPRKFFTRPPNYQALREALTKIPANASVSAQDTLVPHLSSRRKVYLLFNLADSDYVIYSLSGFDYLTVYPVVKEGFVEFDRKMRVDDRYRLIFDQDGVVVFCRRGSQSCPT